MKTAYLYCKTGEAEKKNKYAFTVYLWKGKKGSGILSKKFFQGKNKMKVNILEENGDTSTILFPKKIMNKDVAIVNSAYLTL